MSRSRRNRQLAAIHLAARDLGLDRDAYEDVLFTVARVRSAADLDAAGRGAVLEHFRARGWKPRTRKNAHPGQPHNLDSEDRGPQLKKIEALLADSRLPWAYADGVAKRMFDIDRVQFCRPDQLHKVIAALVYDQRRRHRNRPAHDTATDGGCSTNDR